MARPGPPGASARASLRLTSHSPDDTRALAAAMARRARRGDRIALHGPLGIGKTEFAKGYARGLGVAAVVISPSFTLMAEYEGRLPMFHLDLYRLDGLEDAYAGGLLDERQGEGVTLIEWAERLDRAVDPRRLEVTIMVGQLPDDRTIELLDPSGAYAEQLAAAAAWADRPTSAAVRSRR